MSASGIAPAGEPDDAGQLPEPVASWYARRRYRSEDYPPDRLAQCKRGRTVTVIVPTRECAATIGGVLEDSVGPLARYGLIDDLVVVDAGSVDGTAAVARRGGARVLFEDELERQLGPALGKGDAMWRALRATGGEIVCFLDGDTADPTPLHLQGLLGPLLADDSLALVKGAFDRPLDADGVKFPHEGGRVTELMARPLLNLHEPLLAGFAQPLAGEFSARRALLERCAFPVGYGVEIAVLIDALRARGLDALAECQLGSRQNRHQSLRALGEMAYAVLAAVEHRISPAWRTELVDADGRYLRPWDQADVRRVPVLERPPIRSAVAL
jgi:glucosyl-3-phosphoglycerate synthase